MSEWPRRAKSHPEPIPAEWVDDLLAAAARAPSILNSQPWLFRVSADTIELYADPARRLQSDLSGREMLISCGAALFGLRLAIRAHGYQPLVGVLPNPERADLLATVQLGAREPLTDGERRLIEALPHRHTRRGAFGPGPLPRGLLIALQHDAVNEHASLALIDRPADYTQLAAIVAKAARTLNSDPTSRADVRRWVRLPDSTARDGVPASSITARPGRRSRQPGLQGQLDLPGQPGLQVRPGQPPGWLARRDLDQGRDIGELNQDGPPPAATAILLTAADTRADWLRTGQALHRLLAHAASQWVFASLNSQPLESAPVRTLIRTRLGLPGAPQLLLEFGLARIARPTPRRPAADLLAPSPPR